MDVRTITTILTGLVLAFASGFANAQIGPCTFTAAQQASSPQRIAIANVACEEHKNWRQPFINLDGRAGWQDGYIPMEAEGEGDALVDGILPWKRVAAYWRDTPALAQMVALGIDGAAQCVNEEQFDKWHVEASCRTFIVSNPWSGAFVSYVIQKSGTKNFTYSHKHITYMRDANDAHPGGPYHLVDFKKEKPETGDLLCYSRAGAVASHRSLVEYMKQRDDSLYTHCDVVVASNLGGDSKLYVIGGNVLQTVMMRKLSLDSAGYFSPPRTSRGGACRVNEERDCSLSRKYWIALLKLQED
ncbi:MAG: DUF2272 domain-containing protein [Pseudomonas sp.]|uniref:DUF2272 domain-containing protein n=1 Tax=Pseudomonas sp. TaxID=306 RepID=UPI001224DCC9|nr:DUF2272 domain-containing protein [Pseudomonas sp.]RZI72493.1 MAG: DUF2272 domain-containing protein [Pseudomonas sp.]